MSKKKELANKEDSDEIDGSEDAHKQISNMEPISNDQASNIFSMLEQEQSKKTY